MPKVIHVDFRGSVTSPNTLARPAGSLKSSVNCIIETPGVLRKGPCLNTTATSTASTQVATGYVHSVRPYKQDSALVAYNGTADTDAEYADTVKVYGIDAASSTGSLSTPTLSPTTLGSSLELFRRHKPSTTTYPSAKLHAVPWGNSVYFTSGFGVRRMDLESSTYFHRMAGVPRGTCGVYRASGMCDQIAFQASGSGIYAVGYGAAYRCVPFFELEDGRKILGAPTDRTVVWNRDAWQDDLTVAAQADLELVIKLPTPLQVDDEMSFITTSGTMRCGVKVYRSEIVNITGGAWPSDELFEIGEFYSSTAGASGVIGVYVFTDSVPDASIFKGPALYTNASSGAGGMLRAKNPPPNFRLLASWGGRLWGACYTELSSIVLRMVGLPADEDSITLTGENGAETYSFETGVDSGANGEIKLIPVGTVDQQKFWAMQCLVTRINLISDQFNAYMLSTGPGQTLMDAGVSILIERKRYSGVFENSGDFTVTFSGAAAKFRPYDADATSNELVAVPKNNINTVWCSEFNEPDAWPPDDRNAFKLGEDNMEILAMHPLEEGLYVFTTRGLFVISGSDESNFRADLVDETAVLIGDECVAKADGALWAWLHKGFAQIKNGRVTYVSQPIQDQLDKIRIDTIGKTTIGAEYDVYKASYSFAASDSKNDRVYLFLPNPDDFA